MSKLSIIIAFLFLAISVLSKKKKKIEPFIPIESMRMVTTESINEERDGSFDKQIIYVIFRKEYVKEKGLLEVTNHFAEGLHLKRVNPDEYVQISARKVGIVITSITDMMEIKEYGKTRKSVLMIKSGEERILGAHVSQEEKEDYYATITGKKRRNRKKKAKTEQKEDL